MNQSNKKYSRPLPSLNALRSFEATARLGSVTLAASELFVTPSAVSHQIHKLEENLGQPLIGFANGKLQLSEAGSALLPGLSDGFMRIREAVELLNRQEEYSSLTLVLRPFFASHWLAPRLHRFWEAYPHIGLRMRYMLEQDETGTSRADLSIEWHRSEPSSVSCVRLMPAFLTIFCNPSLIAPDGPLAHPENLADQTFYRETKQDYWGDWLALAGVPDLKPARTLFLDDGTIRVQAAIEGKGIELSVGDFLSNELQSKRLVAPFNDIQIEGYYFLVHRTDLISANAQAFQDWLP